MSFGEGTSENVVGSPNERVVAATTTKEGKRHSLTLAWREEPGQYLSIGQGGTPVRFRSITGVRCAAARPRGNIETR